MLLLIFLLAIPALKSSCGDLREECSGGGSTGFGDFDSLHVAIVPYAITFPSDEGNAYYQYNVPSGGGASHQGGYEQLPINQHNLDSIMIDSARISAFFWEDSVGVYLLYVRFWELDAEDSYTEKVCQFFGNSVGDSLYPPAGSCSPPCWRSKVSAASNENIVNGGFICNSWSYYCFNWDDATITTRNYPILLYLRAFYSKP